MPSPEVFLLNEVQREWFFSIATLLLIIILLIPTWKLAEPNKYARGRKILSRIHFTYVTVLTMLLIVALSLRTHYHYLFSHDLAGYDSYIRYHAVKTTYSVIEAVVVIIGFTDTYISLYKQGRLRDKVRRHTSSFRTV